MNIVRKLQEKAKGVHYEVLQVNSVLSRDYHNLKKLHFQNFKYNARYRVRLTLVLSMLFGAALSSMTMLVCMVENGRQRHQSEYYRLWLATYDKLSVQRQPHMSQVIERGYKRGLSSFEHLELAGLTRCQQIKYHGEYLAELKQQ